MDLNEQSISEISVTSSLFAGQSLEKELDAIIQHRQVPVAFEEEKREAQLICNHSNKIIWQSLNGNDDLIDCG